MNSQLYISIKPAAVVIYSKIFFGSKNAIRIETATPQTVNRNAGIGTLSLPFFAKKAGAS
ncbi:hypothetical protein D3C78_1825370 [compost metagenome]